MSLPRRNYLNKYPIFRLGWCLEILAVCTRSFHDFSANACIQWAEMIHFPDKMPRACVMMWTIRFLIHKWGISGKLSVHLMSEYALPANSSSPGESGWLFEPAKLFPASCSAPPAPPSFDRSMSLNSASYYTFTLLPLPRTTPFSPFLSRTNEILSFFFLSWHFDSLFISKG